MYKKYLSTKLIAAVLSVLNLTTCDQFNIVEPRFFSDVDIVDIPFCSVAGNITSSQVTSQNMTEKEWPNYKVITYLYAEPLDILHHADTDSISYYFLIRYNIKNIDSDTFNLRMNLSPPVLFEIDSVNYMVFNPPVTYGLDSAIFNNPITFDTLEAVKTLIPNIEYEVFSNIIFIREAATKEQKFHLNASIIGCYDPAFTFPMEFEFEYYHEIIDNPALPIETDISACWNDNKTSLSIIFTFPEPSHIELYILNWNGSVARELSNDKRPPGHYWFTWDLKNDKGKKVEKGDYVILFRTDSFEKIIGFEID